MPELVAPDLIIGPGEIHSDDPLNPCPSCGATPHQAPEGLHDAISVLKHPSMPDAVDDDGVVSKQLKIGDPKWNFQHCWKCGFRPGVNVAVSTGAMRDAFERFKQMYAAEFEKLHAERQLPATNTEEIQALKDQIAELKNQLTGGASS